MKKLTAKQVALVKALNTKNDKGVFNTIAEAAVIAGYSDLNPAQSGSQALSGIRVKMPQVLARHGLTEDALVTKYLLPLLNAEETIFAQKDGLFTDSRDVVDNGTRRAALDMTFKVGGYYRGADDEDKGDASLTKITVVIEDVSREGARTITAKAERVQ